jgi:lipid A disaccharide synthetase
VDSVPKKTDRAAAIEKLKLNKTAPVVSFLPGSRPFQINYMLPFFLDTTRIMKKISPDVQFLMISSPFLSEDEIKKALHGKGTLYSQDGDKYVQMDNGFRVRIVSGDRHEAISASDLVLTIPGTNTAEIGALGVPMVSVFPTNFPDEIPLEGTIDLICRVPLLGMLLKRTLIKWIAMKTRYFALPNIKANKELVPEINGNTSPKEAAAQAMARLRDKEWLEDAGKKLKEIMGPRGAAKKVAEEALRMGGGII